MKTKPVIALKRLGLKALASLLLFGAAFTHPAKALESPKSGQPAAAPFPETQADAGQPAANRSEPIPIDQLGAAVGKQYQGDGVSVIATSEGARLQCIFQRVAGDVTREGLWLNSTTGDAAGDRLRVVAAAVGREPGVSSTPLARTSQVEVAGPLARFIRPGLTEEYSVSVDGVRQDFVFAERLAGAGELRVELALEGARAEAAADGARLTLAGSGRGLAYSRLRVEDATGRKLAARLEVLSASRLAVQVVDADATYPVRIDPTFTDADWVNLGSPPGVGVVTRCLCPGGDW